MPIALTGLRLERSAAEMCGIFGLIDLRSGFPVSQEIVSRATDLMAHRGPDGRGVWTENGAGFGHRRLAVIDPTGSPQPMRSRDGRYVLTYNGELYNYREIRNELTDQGVRFQTRGDTEVVLSALIRWGKDALLKFNGMFALGIWDCVEQKLLLARDRLAVKPLLYAYDAGRIAFASEYPPLLSLSWISSQPDPLGVVAYLSHYQTTFDGRTIYRDISSLDGGQYLLFDGSGLKVKHYWRPAVLSSEDRSTAWPNSRINEAAEEVRRLMTQAVSLNSVADVEVGAFLSGGIDSSLITTLMAKETPGKVKAFSIGFAEEGFNEFEFSQSLVSGLGLSNCVITLPKEDYFPLTEELIRHKAAPLSTPNEVPIYSLSKAASAQLKVVLTGEGADELFGGYAALLRSPHDFGMAEALKERPQDFTNEQRSSMREAIRRLYGKVGFTNQLDHWRTSYAWLSRADIGAALMPGFAGHREMAELDSMWEKRLNSLDGLTLYDKYLYFMETEHLRGLLTRLDACTMAGSLEGRVPFTENNLVEFVWALPFEYKLRWNSPQSEAEAFGRNSLEVSEKLDTGKYILKKAFNELLPTEITARPKKAFPVPLEVWLNGRGRSEILSELALSRSGRAILDPKVADWANQSLSTGMGAMKVWMVWNLAMWMDL